MQNNTIAAVLLDDVALTLDELARACDVETDWVVHHVQAGVLGNMEDRAPDPGSGVQVASWRFRSGDLQRARRLLKIERDFDANEQLAALVVDMMDEIRRLRARMRTLGID